MMKNLARACLRVVMLTIPVVIAACYGAPARLTRNGKVIDKQTSAGIENIGVWCATFDGMATGDSALTYDSSGDFTLYYFDSNNCYQLVATDNQRPIRYQETKVPLPSSGDVTIQMDKVP